MDLDIDKLNLKKYSRFYLIYTESTGFLNGILKLRAIQISLVIGRIKFNEMVSK
jgi:hypothetical protein